MKRSEKAELSPEYVAVSVPRVHRAFQPVHYLILEILELAIRDALGDVICVHKRKEHPKHYRDAALVWLFNDLEYHPDCFTFIHCCEILDVPSQTIRNKVILALEGNLDLSVPAGRRETDGNMIERLFG